MKLCIEVYYFYKVSSQEKMWSDFTFLKFNFKEDKFGRCKMGMLKVGDLIVVKRGNVSPVDLLVLDTGLTKQRMKVFVTLENRLFGIENFVHKSSIKNFSQDKQVKERNTSAESTINLIPRLSMQLNYAAPEASDITNSYFGTYKLQNDPKMNPIRKKHIMFCGSKLASNWVFGIVLYNGCNSHVFYKHQNMFSLRNRISKKSGRFLRIGNFMILISLLSSFI